MDIEGVHTREDLLHGILGASCPRLIPCHQHIASLADKRYTTTTAVEEAGTHWLIAPIAHFTDSGLFVCVCACVFV